LRRKGVPRAVAAGLLVLGVLIGLAGYYVASPHGTTTVSGVKTATSVMSATATEFITINETAPETQTIALTTTLTQTVTRLATAPTTTETVTATASVNYSVTSTSTATATTTTATTTTAITTVFLSPTTTVTSTQTPYSNITVINFVCESGAAQASTCYVGLKNTGNALDLAVSCSLAGGTSTLTGAPVPISPGSTVVATCTGAPSDTFSGETAQGTFAFYSGEMVSFTGIYS
jgi:hypothetical protein